MKYYFLVILFITLLDCKANEFKDPTNLDSIPRLLLEHLMQLNGGNFELASPYAPFQSTDIVGDEKLPWRQLCYLETSKNIILLTYKHSGIGLHYHIILCEIEDGKIKSFISGVTLSKVETFKEVYKAIRKKKVYYRNVDSKEEIDKV
jgi:hypothetical protein